MNRTQRTQLSAERKELLDELALAEEAFDTSHARLRATLEAAEAGRAPATTLRDRLKQHLTATACLFAVNRALASLRVQYADRKRVAKRRGGRQQGMLAA